MGSIPKKILEIQDLAYILPDDFNGSISEALLHMLKYIEGVVKEEREIKEREATEDPSILNLVESDFEKKASLKYVIHEFNEETNTYEAHQYIFPTK